MIMSFRSRALKRFWERGDESQFQKHDLQQITDILDALDAATCPNSMDLPGLKFHSLKGDMLGRYSVTVRANYRITFAWSDGDAVEVDYEDYH
ncbi:MAG TPA: type II toxin-antitoxin system RelE/ParE family toxin [Alphaproteobacteria bacterium]|nr:type II toxin-antitoxin system RelE/ParE family toxin [Alphaproteobacteria bacterium]